MSLARILHARAISKEFLKRSDKENKPDIVVAGLPSPELCMAGFIYARKIGIPFVIDIRDPGLIYYRLFPYLFSIPTFAFSLLLQKKD